MYHFAMHSACHFQVRLMKRWDVKQNISKKSNLCLTESARTGAFYQYPVVHSVGTESYLDFTQKKTPN